MGSQKRIAAIVLSLAGAASLGSVAQAVPVSCPGTAANTDREFILNTTPTPGCVDWGTGNFDNVADGEAAYTALGWATIDKTDGAGGTMNGALTVSNLDASSGQFWIDAAVWDTYLEVLFVMKSGVGQYDPDWAVFSLAKDTVYGLWSIVTKYNNANGLSHVNLYYRGRVPEDPPTPVAEPATLALFATALLGLAIVRRRRRLPIR
jgi:hypothetical protein